MSLAAQPYLSVVVATRNDDHGGDPLKRLQAFINTFAAQCRRTSLDAEVIVVEWNPPSDKPRVAELCRVPPGAPFAVRFVEVPAALHQRLRFSSVLPLFQMIAKNAGIRRARGRFVLATNIDIIFSNELVEQLASGTLVPGRMYRVDRHDIQSDFPVDAPLAEQMTFCQTHQIRVHAKSGTHPVDSLGRLRTLDADIVGSAVFRLGDGWHTREGDQAQGFFRWAGQEASVSIDRTAAPNLVRGALLDVEVEPNPYQPGSWIDIAIMEGERRLAQRRISHRTRFRVALEDGVARHEIVLRTLDSSGGRQWLPLFESRGPLCCRVWHIGIGSAPSHRYDIGSWRGTLDRSPGLTVQHTPAGVEITTAPDRHSYCAEYGPFTAPADGGYEFLLEYLPIDGRISFTVMDDERSCWLPSKIVEMEGDGVRLVNLSVELRRGTKFSLFVSNYLPADGVSRVVLRRLLGSVPIEELQAPPRASIAGRSVRRLRNAAGRVTASFRRKGTSSPPAGSHRELEARLAALAPLAELAPFAEWLREHRPVGLHQNACGDFQLMAREHWHALRGYAELEMFSMSLDGLLEMLAHAAGIGEEFFDFPICIYHLEHEKGSGWTPEGEAELKKRIAASGITWLDMSTVHIWSAYMQWLRRPMIFNDAGWGFGDVTLPETTLQAVAGGA